MDSTSKNNPADCDDKERRQHPKRIARVNTAKNFYIIRRNNDYEGKWFRLSYHTCSRMKERGISPDSIMLALKYGKRRFTRGAKIFAIGKKEIVKYSEYDQDLKELNGLQVVCSTDSNFIMTAYFNADFRPLRRKRKYFSS